MKLSLRQEEVSILIRVRDFLTQEKIDSYLVGGYIRDSLLDRPTRDIDIAVTTSALEAAKKVAAVLNGRYVLLDEANEIARVVLLEDDSVQGRWHLDFSTIREGIEENLSHRDFTIDALAIDLRELETASAACLIDPFQGQKDLKEGIIRAVSEAAFEDDPARLLRAVRLAAEYGLAIEQWTEALIQSQAQLISQVAGERVREELCRLLSVQNAAPYLYYLDRLGLLTAIVPELTATKGVEQPREHYWDVFQHSIETVAALERLLQSEDTAQKDAILSMVPHIPRLSQHFQQEVSHGVSRAVLAKIAALLHDVAKPQTKSTEPNGRARFLGHTKQGAAMAGDILQRLRFSNREMRTVQKIIESHLRLWQMGGEGKPTHRAIYRFFRDTEDASIDILFLTLADFLAAQGPHLDMSEWQQHCQMIEYIWSEHEQEEARIIPQKLIDGHDLIDILRLEPSPVIGQLLEAIREAQGIGEITTREEAIAFARRQLDQCKTSEKVV
ncbi:MAG: HD domain-containing protein [Chloroflexi bacterium]|nr:HD domain-containing protein [Chloroflexota bacterium]